MEVFALLSFLRKISFELEGARCSLMDFVEIENLRKKTDLLLPRLCGMSRVILLNHYYNELLSTNHDLLIQAFCLEFINEYLSSFEFFNPHFASPEKSDDYIQTLENLSKIDFLSDYSSKFASTIDLVKNLTSDFSEHLNNSTPTKKVLGELFFPLIGSNSVNEKVLVYNSIE